MAAKPRRSRGARRTPHTVSKRRLPARSSTAREGKGDGENIRLNKFLADQGVASRRACDELIAAGKVIVDGEPVTELGSRIDATKQTVEVAGRVLRPEGLVRRYYLLNKPPGVVCTSEQRELRPRAVDLITDPNKGRIYTIGRLDEDSTGLILLTNDGDFAQRIAHPRHGIAKTYAVRVFGKITDEAVQKVRQGVHLSEGKTAGARVVVLRRTAAGTNLEVTLREGKNREVRRSFARVGHKVLTLKRIRIGPLTDRGIKGGKWRALSRDEVESLLNQSDALGTDQPMHPSIEPYAKPGRNEDWGYGRRSEDPDVEAREFREVSSRRRSGKGRATKSRRDEDRLAAPRPTAQEDWAMDGLSSRGSGRRPSSSPKFQSKGKSTSSSSKDSNSGWEDSSGSGAGSRRSRGSAGRGSSRGGSRGGSRDGSSGNPRGGSPGRSRGGARGGSRGAGRGSARDAGSSGGGPSRRGGGGRGARRGKRR